MKEIERKEAVYGPTNIIERIYPEFSKFAQDKLSARLRKYASEHTAAWPKGLLLSEPTSSGRRTSYSYHETSCCFIRNLLDLDALLKSPAKTIEYLNTKDRRKKYQTEFAARFRELRWRGEQYTRIAALESACLENLLNDIDLSRENIFAQQSPHTISQKTDLKDSLKQDASFVQLRALERIEILEQDSGYSDLDRFANLSVLYLESGNIELALEYSTKALRINNQCEHAWMVRGYLALNGVKQAFQDTFLHQELGTTQIAITSEELHHQQMADDARSNQENRWHKATLFFLNAWRFWSDRSDCFLQNINSTNYELQIIQKLFTHAKSDQNLDHSLLKRVINEKHESLKNYIDFHGSTEILLTSIIPVLQVLDQRLAKDLATKWMNRVRQSEEHDDHFIPSNPFDNRILIDAGSNFRHIGNLNGTIPFEDLERFIQLVDTRFKHAKRCLYLKTASELYLKAITTSFPLANDDIIPFKYKDYMEAIETSYLVGSKEYRNAFDVCISALENLEFMDNPFDLRLRKQWKYLAFKMLALSIFEDCIEVSNNLDRNCDTIAAQFLNFATVELLQDISGADFFEIKNDYDDAFPEGYYYRRDLMKDQWHILYRELDDFYRERYGKPMPEGVAESEKNKTYISYIVSSLLKSTRLAESKRESLSILALELEKIQNEPEPSFFWTNNEYLEWEELPH